MAGLSSGEAIALLLASMLSGIAVAIAIALFHAARHAGRDDERFYDVDRRLTRLEHHAGFYERREEP